MVSVSEKLGDAHCGHDIVLQVAILHSRSSNEQVTTFVIKAVSFRRQVKLK